MPELPPDLLKWAMAEWDRLETVIGEEGLGGRWQVADALLRAGDTDGAVDMIRELMDLAKEEGSVDWQLRGYEVVKAIYSTDARFADLRQDVLWYSKWIVDGLHGIADLPEEKILHLLDEMQALYEKEGESLRPVYGERMDTALGMGRLDEARRWHELWQQAPRSPSDDCEACERDREMTYLVGIGELGAAMEVGREILAMPSDCSNLPAMLSRVMGLAAHHRDYGLAMHLHLRTCRDVRRVPSHLGVLSIHQVVLLQLGDVRRARRLAATSLYRSKGLRNDGQRFRILRSVALWAGSSLVRGVERNVGRQITIPRFVLHHQPDDATGSAGLAETATSCLDAAWHIARTLDARNGNRYYAGWMQVVEDQIRADAEAHGGAEQ